MKKANCGFGFLLVFLLWMILHLFVEPRLIPNPINTLLTLGSLLISGELLMHSLFSLYRLGVAIMLSLVLGTGTGVVMGLNKLYEKLLVPFMYVMFPIPKAALLPILFVLFGLGDASKITLIWLILYFQIVIAVYDAVKSIDAEVFTSAKTLSLSKKQLCIHVIFPVILPNILSVLRTSVGIGIAVLFFAETYATDRGLGYFIMNHWSLLNYQEMYAGILFLSIIGYTIFRGVDYLRFKLVKWI